MKRLFLVLLIILFLVPVVFAQPVNKPIHLVCDNQTAAVERSLVEINGAEQDASLSLYQVMADYTRLFNLSNYLPGPWSMRARVLGVTSGDVIGEWSGWSNTITVTKPATVTMRTVDGYLVVDPEPGTAISNIYYNGAVEQGLFELVDGNLRVYDLSSLPAGQHALWAQLVHTSGWEGDWPVNPIVVTKSPAPPAPVLRIQVE